MSKGDCSVGSIQSQLKGRSAGDNGAIHMCINTSDVPETDCWISRCIPWRPAGVRVSAHVNMHAA